MKTDKTRKKLRFWVYPVLMRRQQHGEFYGLIQESKLLLYIF